MMNPDDKENKAHQEQLRQLFLSQKNTLDIFLRNGAVSQAQYDKSLGDLKKKMGLEAENPE